METECPLTDEWIKIWCIHTYTNIYVTPWTVAHQAPQCMGFSRQEYWSELPFPSPGDLPNPGMEHKSPALAGRFFTIWATMETHIYMYEIKHKFIKHLSNKIIKLIPECFNLCPAEILSQINLCGRACLMRWIPTASPSPVMITRNVSRSSVSLSNVPWESESPDTTNLTDLDQCENHQYMWPLLLLFFKVCSPTVKHAGV